MIFLQLSGVFRIGKNVPAGDGIFVGITAIGITVIIGIPKKVNMNYPVKLKFTKKITLEIRMSQR